MIALAMMLFVMFCFFIALQMIQYLADWVDDIRRAKRERRTV